MIWMKRTVLAAAGAALIACAPTGLSAAPIGQAATEAAKRTAAQSDTMLTPVRRHWGGRRHGGWYGHRYRHRHRHGGVRFFFAAPIVIGHPHHYRGYDDYGGYRDRPGFSCYKMCREEHGPDYCRDYWRRYCR